VRAGLLASAHDIAEGGLAVALAECCLAGEVGASVRLADDFWETIRLLAPGPRSSSPVSELLTALFGEGPGGFLVSGDGEGLRRLGEGTPLLALGTVGGGELRIEITGQDQAISLTLAELAGAHAGLEELFA
jgi:phosphoribosylformylglycinamidine synthase subunit PurL